MALGITLTSIKVVVDDVLLEVDEVELLIEVDTDVLLEVLEVEILVELDVELVEVVVWGAVVVLVESDVELLVEDVVVERDVLVL